MSDSSNWISLCAARKQKQIDSIPKEWIIQLLPPGTTRNVLDVPYTCGLLSAKEIQITDTIDIQLLLTKLKTAEWSSVEVTTAFYKRAIIAHQLVGPSLLDNNYIPSFRLQQTNCLTEIFVDRALERAKQVDDHLRRTGKPIGPLHGLPISLKDQFSIKGLETIMGNDFSVLSMHVLSNSIHPMPQDTPAG